VLYIIQARTIRAWIAEWKRKLLAGGDPETPIPVLAVLGSLFQIGRTLG
jgi:hypothetical protein